MGFAERVEAVWGSDRNGQNSDLLILMCPYLGEGKFYLDEEKCYPLSKLLRNSEVRRGRNRVVLLVPIWSWQEYLRRMVERAERLAMGTS
jgi:hypothetical protein